MVVAVVVSRAVVVMAGFVVVHVVMAGVLAMTQLALHARTANRAQHCRRHRAPDGEQDSQQEQQPDSSELHRSVQ